VPCGRSMRWSDISLPFHFYRDDNKAYCRSATGGKAYDGTL
jgi:hypothetical protein